MFSADSGIPLESLGSLAAQASIDSSGTAVFSPPFSLFSEMIENQEFDEFLTLPAYGRLLTRSS